MNEDQPWWTQHRRELLRWFEDRAPSFADGYKGALQLLHTPSFPARVHFVCHIVRDIYRRLPNSLGVRSLPRPGEVFPNMVKSLRERWDKFPAADLLHECGMNTGFAVSPQVFRQVETIVRKSKELQEQPTVGEQLANALFRSLDRAEEAFIERWIIDSFDAEYDFFVARAHLAASVERTPNDDGLEQHFLSFERAFHSLIGPYFSGKEELDAILQDTNPRAN